MHDSKTTLDAFLDAVAAKHPTPAGGSAAALVGALSASLGAMAVNYSIGAPGLEGYEGELRPALAEFERARALLTRLMMEDQAAYEALLAARKLPAAAPDRQGKLDVALLASIRVPQAVAATAVAILELCDQILNFVNPKLLADLAVCADLAMATTRCAIYAVRANAKQVSDPADRTSIESTTSQLLSRAAGLIQRVSPRIWERDAESV